MKVFTPRFFVGVTLTGLGLLCLLIGISAAVPPNKSFAIGVPLLLTGIALTLFGRKIAKDAPQPGHKVAIDTLQKAKLPDKKLRTK